MDIKDEEWATPPAESSSHRGLHVRRNAATMKGGSERSELKGFGVVRAWRLEQTECFGFCECPTEITTYGIDGASISVS